MADDALLTINDLPDDMLHEVFGLVIADDPASKQRDLPAARRPPGPALRVQALDTRGLLGPAGARRRAHRHGQGWPTWATWR